jgi:hypothetical protein
VIVVNAIILRPLVRADSPDLRRRCAAEAIAAFALVFAGCGAIVANAYYSSTLGALAYRLVRGGMIE